MCQRWIKVRGSRSSARLHTAAALPVCQRGGDWPGERGVNGRNRDTGRSKAPVKWDVGNQIFQRDALCQKVVLVSRHTKRTKQGRRRSGCWHGRPSHNLQKLSCFPHWGLVPTRCFLLFTFWVILTTTASVWSLKKSTEEKKECRSVLIHANNHEGVPTSNFSPHPALNLP